MAKTTGYIQEGDTLDYLNNTSADIEYREVIALGGRIFIAGENIKIGELGSVNTNGVWELPADNTVSFEFGDTLYWDKSTGKLTKTSGAFKAGYAANSKIQSAITALVNIG